MKFCTSCCFKLKSTEYFETFLVSYLKWNGTLEGIYGWVKVTRNEQWTTKSLVSHCNRFIKKTAGLFFQIPSMLLLNMTQMWYMTGDVISPKAPQETSNCVHIFVHYWSSKNAIFFQKLPLLREQKVWLIQNHILTRQILQILFKTGMSFGTLITSILTFSKRC